MASSLAAVHDRSIEQCLGDLGSVGTLQRTLGGRCGGAHGYRPSRCVLSGPNDDVDEEEGVNGGTRAMKNATEWE
ncbi:hypothetical protein HPB52_022598 [Rhipicephalus sanguineus]|uniref:Uncharacterized protein n=1 Tax=Rhipicephalus sanguineus TaxID=34632 RepID=A0A9D4PY09_RHISA|nr:hypothetical protein HPB52_022598 [Rhipicephalus sanguineus]